MQDSGNLENRQESASQKGNQGVAHHIISIATDRLLWDESCGRDNLGEKAPNLVLEFILMSKTMKFGIVNLAAMAAINSADVLGMQRGRTAGPIKSALREMEVGQAIFIVDPAITSEDIALWKSIPSKNAAEKNGSVWGSFEQSVRPLSGNSPTKDEKSGRVKYPLGLTDNNAEPGIGNGPRRFRTMFCRNSLGVLAHANPDISGVPCYDLSGNRVDFADSLYGALVYRLPDHADISQGSDESEDAEVSADDTLA